MSEAVPATFAPENRGDVAVQVNGLDKSYRRGVGSRRRTVALRGCELELPAGSVTALVGANGAGKSTLLAVLAGLATADSGTVRLGGRSAFVAQDKPVYRHLTAAGNLALVARLNGRWDEERARGWLERFEVPLDRVCGRLSGGQRALVALAIALGACPDVLLLDEPLAELDPLVRRDVSSELLSRSAETGMTVVLSTHVVTEVFGMVDHVVVLGDGRTVLAGEVDELLTDHVEYSGPSTAAPPDSGTVIDDVHHGPRSRYTVRLAPDERAPTATDPWTVTPVALEDLLHAYLASNRKVAQR